jgi:hypothetical protein
MGEKEHRPSASAAALGSAMAALVLSACWNGAFQDNAVYGDSRGSRFEMLIEPERNDVDATHFLVDRATGDIWRFEASSRTSGRWVRLADGPTDAAELESSAPHDEDEG